MSPTERPQLPAGLYAIADAAFGDPVELGLRVADAGCRVVQLRCKGWSEQDLSKAAAALVAGFRRTGTLLLVNDHVEVAAAVGAHGVHLGQDDGPLAPARERLGPGAIIGRSTHDAAQVLAAQDADYLGFGPVFGTPTKDTGYGPRGLDALALACRLSTIPVVAIGGITSERLPGVQTAGAHGWAVISALWTEAPLAARVQALSGR